MTKQVRDFSNKYDFMAMTFLSFEDHDGLVPRDSPEIAALYELANRATDADGARMGIRIGLARLKDRTAAAARVSRVADIRNKVKPKHRTREEIQEDVKSWIRQTRDCPIMRAAHIAEYEEEIRIQNLNIKG